MKASAVKKIVLQLIGGSPLAVSTKITEDGAPVMLQAGSGIGSLVSKFGSLAAAAEAVTNGDILSNPLKSLSSTFSSTILTDATTSVSWLNGQGYTAAATFIQTGQNALNSALSNLEQYSDKLIGLVPLGVDEDLLSYTDVLNLKNKLGDEAIGAAAGVLDTSLLKGQLDTLITEQRHKFTDLFTQDGVQRDTAAAELGAAMSASAAAIQAAITATQTAQTQVIGQLETLAEVESIYGASGAVQTQLVKEGVVLRS